MSADVYTYKYPHPAVATDCVIFGFAGKDLQVLLIKRGLPPYEGCWAFPGGFLKMDETLEEGAERELREETGLVPNHIEQFYTFSSVDRDPRERVLSVAFFALVKVSPVYAADDAKEAQWFPVDSLPQLAFDHDLILKKALQTLRERIHFEPIGFELMGTSFSLPDLQCLYEAILGVNFDRRNFQKKILQLELLDEVKSDVCIEKESVSKVACSVSYELFKDSLKLERKSIDQLFADTSCLISNEEAIVNFEMVNSEDTGRITSAGRKPKLYSFNRDKYESMKEKGNGFKLEF